MSYAVTLELQWKYLNGIFVTKYISNNTFGPGILENAGISWEGVILKTKKNKKIWKTANCV